MVFVNLLFNTIFLITYSLGISQLFGFVQYFPPVSILFFYVFTRFLLVKKGIIKGFFYMPTRIQILYAHVVE